MRIIGLAGWSGSGKTTLVTKVIPRLIARGIRVSTVKHAHHGFDLDQPGKDSFMHRVAGATEVVISSAKRFAILHELREEPEWDLPDLLGKLAPVDLVLVEGAGSPAEINLRANDIANMGFARAAGVPVVLLGDIDRGGVFAHFLGTLDCLSASERDRVAGFVVNKFRGDRALLEPGIAWLQQRSGKHYIEAKQQYTGTRQEVEYTDGDRWFLSWKACAIRNSGEWSRRNLPGWML